MQSTQIECKSIFLKYKDKKNTSDDAQSNTDKMLVMRCRCRIYTWVLKLSAWTNKGLRTFHEWQHHSLRVSWDKHCGWRQQSTQNEHMNWIVPFEMMHPHFDGSIAHHIFTFVSSSSTNKSTTISYSIAFKTIIKNRLLPLDLVDDKYCKPDNPFRINSMILLPFGMTWWRWWYSISNN